MKKNPQAAFVLLRFGLAFVFLWFASNQIAAPEKWVGFLPGFVKSLPMSAVTFVLCNAVFEIVGASLLLLGAWTRPAALILGLHLLGIAFTIGLSATGIRDVGLAVAALALALGGAGTFSIDTKAESASAAA